MYSDSSVSSDQQYSTTLVGATESIRQNEDSMTMPLIPSNPERERVGGGLAAWDVRIPTSAAVLTIRWADENQEEKKRRAGSGGNSSFAPDNARPAKHHECHIEGCGKSYRRNEHLKRHIQT
jgi:uncharacterized Zn-finger protein